MKTFARIIFAMGATAAIGCSHGPRSVADRDPAEKIPAIELAVQKNDRRVIPQLVIDLDNDDPAIRFYAIEALRKMTRLDFGYQYFLDQDDRKPAVEQWKQWLAKQP